MPERIPCQKADLSRVHESLRAAYGDGMPLRTYKVGGVTVRIWGADLPATQEENRNRVRNAYRVADGIMARANGRGTEYD